MCESSSGRPRRAETPGEPEKTVSAGLQQKSLSAAVAAIAVPTVVAVAVAAVAAALLSAALAVPAGAETREAVAGKMRLRYESSRWTLSNVTPDSFVLTPSDPLDRKRSQVTVLRSPQNCADLAKAHLPDSLYVVPTIAPDTLAGRRGERHTAHTLCRNATPRGELLCVPTPSGTYALIATIASCRGGPGFGRGDPFEDFFDSVRFLP
ncbi:hypothetical protein ABB55_05655 [Prosthecomicrobium hirschii]|uniref:Uncharacterized protein n=1 Tax=Prosthecodimorpha hirschii TaxID=665126 RepID=A0A0P6VI74_9HYPH|nr:hypothetical protein [Prosthecomicrobium hirschii]KPL51779.1 hypothetical protein ABB55_05655 [Prosthecomicrobium hirschii]